MYSLKTFLTLIFIAIAFQAFPQNIGINEDGSNPDASAILDIKSNDKGLLVPRLTTAQRTGIAAPATGLIVYDTSTSGFWFYDGGAWVEIASGTIAGNTLDAAYDEGGAGAGRIITADGGVVSVQGTDGIEVTGNFGSGATIGSPGAGTRMFFNPRKAAFRAGSVTFNQWDDANVGDYSIGLGRSAEASGTYDAAIGFGARATGTYSTALGWANHASGAYSLAAGGDSDASGFGSVAIGRMVEASGGEAFAAGQSTLASGDNATALGNSTTASGVYSLSTGWNTAAVAQNVAVFGRYNVGGGNPTTWVATDPLFEVGNGSNSSNLGNALTILKNGNVGLATATPSATLDVVGTFQLVDGNEAPGRVLTSDANGNATWVTPATGGNTLDGAYDQGGAGAGRIIDADAGAVSVQGTDGFEVTGSYTPLGTIPTSGSGTRMFFYPSKSAFRAGTVGSTNWNTGFVGNFSIGLGNNPLASGSNSVAIGPSTEATGSSSIAIGNQAVSSSSSTIALGQNAEASGSSSAALGYNSLSSGIRSAAIGNLADAGANYSIALGGTTVSGADYSLAGPVGTTEGEYGFAMGSGTVASGDYSFAFGLNSQASGLYSISLGSQSVASQSGALAIGLATTAEGVLSAAFNFSTTATAFNSSAFGRFNVGGGNPTTWLAADPLFEIGIGTSTSNKANAFTVLKNGNTGIMNSNPDATLDVVGTFQLVDGNQAAGRVLTSDATGNATWATPVTSGNTLDGAYDEGGPGAGRTINAENGAVHINRTSSTAGSALEISVNSSYTLSERSAIITTNALTGFETYTNINKTGGPPFGKAFLITHDPTANIIGLDGIAIELNQSSALNYLGESRGFLYDVTYNGGSSGSIYGYQANIEGSGGAVKYGAHVTIPSSSGGTHYGIYSDVQKTSGYAAYLIGRTSLGAGTSNRYLMPAADGSAGQIMTTDGAGNVSWAAPASGGGSLDDAYDDGGAGNGRIIAADAGVVSVQGTDGFEVTGTFNSGATIGNPGAGVRMFFNPRTASFRAGRVTGTQWDQANVGVGSAAFGFNNTVSGSYSVAFGGGNSVTSSYAVAMGENCQAQGAFSVAMGGSAVAIGESAIAIGEASTANGDLAVAFSEGTANGASSLAHGRGIISNGSYEFATGEYNTLYTPNGTLTDRAFVVGNGTGPAARSNALILQKNGLLTINDEYTLPNTDGTEGQTLVTDGAGAVSWSGPIAFSAYLNTNSALTNGNFVMSTVDFTSNCTFNIAQVRFDAPVDGIYSFTFNDVSQAALGSTQGIQIVNGFGVVRQATWVTESTGTTARSFTFTLQLDAGDIITFDKLGNRTLIGSNAYPACRISGHLVR